MAWAESMHNNLERKFLFFVISGRSTGAPPRCKLLNALPQMTMHSGTFGRRFQRDMKEQTVQTPLSSSPLLPRFMAALMHAKWLNACGTLPICSPEMATSSENMPRWFAKESTLSKCARALLCRFEVVGWCGRREWYFAAWITHVRS